MSAPLNLILLLLLTYSLQAQSIYEPIASENIALGNTNSTIANSWSGFHNSANLASLSDPALAIAFYNQYSLAGINSSALAFAYPINPENTLFLGMKHFGDELYNEQRVAFAYGSQLGIIQIGATLNYMQLLIAQFGKKQTFSADLGVTAQLAETIKIGAYANNITNTYTSKAYEQYLPILIGIGIQYQPTSFLFANAEIEKQINLSAFLKAGISYQLVKFFHLRIGLRTDTAEGYYGFGLKFLKLQLDYALSNHPALGLSNAVSLQYDFKSR